MATKIQLRRGTTSEWSTNNPVLSDGELGWDRTLNKLKFGDGSTPWNDLPFLTDATGGGGGSSFSPKMSFGRATDISNRQVSGGGVTCAPDAWSFWEYSSAVSQIGVQSTVGEYGWVYTEPGLYCVNLKFSLGLVPDAEAAPEYVEAAIVTWDGAEAQTRIPLFANGSVHVGIGSMMLGPYYSVGSPTENNEQSANQLLLSWKGDAALGNQNGPPYTANAIRAEFSRIA